MNSIKKLCLIVALMTISGVYAFAQTSGPKIVSVHPDLKVRITRCEAAAKTVVVNLVFENVGSTDTKISCNPAACSAYDDEGDKFSGWQFSVSIANGNLIEGTYYGTPRELLPSDIPVKAKIQIEGVPESATMLRRIDLCMSSDEWGFRNKVVKITNVPISREGDE